MYVEAISIKYMQDVLDFLKFTENLKKQQIIKNSLKQFLEHINRLATVSAKLVKPYNFQLLMYI